MRELSRIFEGETGPVEALRDIDLTVEPGEFCVLVGPSGCGKTTLLRMIAGLDQPSSGSVETRLPAGGGRPTNAVVFQGRSVFPWLSVRDNVAYGLRLRGVGRREQEATAGRLIDLVGLTGSEQAYPHQLSEGMRQRVAIGRALAVDPDILLMDEPFGALDEQLRFTLQEELLGIWAATGKTIVLVTHSIDEAMVLADQIVLLGARPGRVLRRMAVPFSRPRTLESVREHPAYASLFRGIRDGLRDGTGPGALEVTR
ncbi:MAG TPA: ABC transporter ATP-binding protein [Thermomicrobiales bacterium]|nr:ABC transporter ATP-binding protein [Thermomicrobiales bacterium]